MEKYLISFPSAAMKVLSHRPHDVLECPRGGRLRVIELVTDAEGAKELFDPFVMSTNSLPIALARSPDWD